MSDFVILFILINIGLLTPALYLYVRHQLFKKK